jgi:hypothetical protein
LDTRLKIVSPEVAGRGAGKVVIGYFDPLFADNVLRLMEIGAGNEGVTVIVADRQDALLPLPARGELVASLSLVSQVVLCEGDISSVLAQLGAAQIFDERESDERRTRELSAHIVERYRPE